MSPMKNTGNSRGVGGLQVHGLPISIFSIFLALLPSMGGFIFGYGENLHILLLELRFSHCCLDTGQISDILLMPDFLGRFAECDGGTCKFSNVRSGLIVSLLSIGTLLGALLGAPYVHANPRTLDHCRSLLL